ncbi:MAG: SMI1/KNR4 family protein [Agriterribacter sp.]
MISRLISEVKKNKESFSIDVEEIKKIKKIVFDKSYLYFLEKTNGGGILDNSLIFYGVLPAKLNSEIFYNNFLFNKYYADLVSGVFLFGEDVFGNQFAFLEDGKIVLINIETASAEFTLNNFDDFVKQFFENMDYYSGNSILEKWLVKYGPVEEFKKLCPRKPFVIGGGYEIDNFYALDKEELFKFNSHLARQIKDLPDGVEIQIKSV